MAEEIDLDQEVEVFEDRLPKDELDDLRWALYSFLKDHDRRLSDREFRFISDMIHWDLDNITYKQEKWLRDLGEKFL